MKKSEIPTEAEHISSFAFSTGRMIENLIKERMDDLEEENNVLLGKIVDWWISNGKDKTFAVYFGINTKRYGKIEKV
jgi:hypothetical protein